MSGLHLIVSGVVQGVGFRYFTTQEARRLGICGTVRNTKDGKVEIYAYGAVDVLDEFLKWCHVGPSSAAIEGLEYQRLLSSSQYLSFDILR